MTRKKPRSIPGQLAAINDCNAAARAERVAQAWQLRLQGRTVRQIAEALNVCEGTAWDFCREGLERARESGAKSALEWRGQILGQLDELIAAWSSVALAPKAEGSQAAAAIVIRAQEHRARLLGLDRVEGVVDLGARQQMTMEEALKSPATRAALRRALDEAEANEKALQA